MSFTRVLAFPMFIFCYSLALSQAQMPAPATAKSADTPAAQTSPAAPIHVPPPSETPSGDEKSYRAEIRQLMNAGNFDQLDHTADLARSNKSRFPGGVWKLYIFYDELRYAGGRGAGVGSRMELAFRYLAPLDIS